MAETRYRLVDLARRMAPVMRPYVPRYLLAMALLLLTALLSLLPPALLKILIDDGIRGRKPHTVAVMSMALIGIFLIAGLSRWAMDYLHEWVSGRFIADLRERLFSHLLQQAMQFHSNTKTGDLLGRLRNDITAVYGVLVNTFLGALSEVVQIAGIMAILVYYNRVLALIALAFIAPLILILKLSGRVLRRLALLVRDKDVDLLDFFHEKLTNIHIIKLFHQESYEVRMHRRISAELIAAILKSVRCRFSATFMISIITGTAGVVVMWFGGYKVIEGSLSFGALFAFYLYTLRLYAPIQTLTNRGVEIFSGLASAQRIMEYFDMAPAIREIDKPIQLPSPRGEISFQEVSFSYNPEKAPALRGITLSIRPGQKLALVGESGAGKSTLINLLGRLYDVSGGAILIDGNDVRELAFQSLYDAIAVVPQEIYLFNNTIEENIRYGCIHATKQEVCDAAHKANLDRFIAGLPQSYATVIGPRGITLSGGERQRLALARAILKNAPIWILDEFTSSLDSHSESSVYEQIMPLIRDKTAIIIAHRLSTILSADIVAVIQDGRIAETGSHTELYERGGIYRSLFDKQYGHASPMKRLPLNEDETFVADGALPKGYSETTPAARTGTAEVVKADSLCGSNEGRGGKHYASMVR